MPRGVAVKGYKMTARRRQVLELLVEEGGTLRSRNGRATSLLYGLIEPNANKEGESQDETEPSGSIVSLNATLRFLEDLEFIERKMQGRRTFEISITDKGRTAIDAPLPVEPAPVAANPVETDQSDWKEDAPAPVPEGVDYDILLGVFLKAALRGMEGPSNGTVAKLQEELDHAKMAIANLEQQVNQYRTEAASAIAERDQLQKNLNIIMSKVDGRSTRGTHRLRDLISPEDQAALDALLRQIPAARG